MNTQSISLFLTKLAILSALPLVKNNLLVMCLVLINDLFANDYLNNLFFH